MVNLGQAVDLSQLVPSQATLPSFEDLPNADDILDNLPWTPASWGSMLERMMEQIHTDKVPAQTGFLKDDSGFVYQLALALVGVDAYAPAASDITWQPGGVGAEVFGDATHRPNDDT